MSGCGDDRREVNIENYEKFTQAYNQSIQNNGVGIVEDGFCRTHNNGMGGKTKQCYGKPFAVDAEEGFVYFITGRHSVTRTEFAYASALTVDDIKAYPRPMRVHDSKSMAGGTYAEFDFYDGVVHFSKFHEANTKRFNEVSEEAHKGALAAACKLGGQFSPSHCEKLKL